MLGSPLQAPKLRAATLTLRSAERRNAQVSCPLLLWMATSTLAFSQLPSGTINGRVIDPQGNIVVGKAHVTVTNDVKRVSLANR